MGTRVYCWKTCRRKDPFKSPETGWRLLFLIAGTIVTPWPAAGSHATGRPYPSTAPDCPGSQCGARPSPSWGRRTEMKRPPQRVVLECRGGDLDSRPRAYESPALPLSYLGVGGAPQILLWDRRIVNSRLSGEGPAEFTLEKNSFPLFSLVSLRG